MLLQKRRSCRPINSQNNKLRICFYSCELVFHITPINKVSPGKDPGRSAVEAGKRQLEHALLQKKKMDGELLNFTLSKRVTCTPL